MCFHVDDTTELACLWAAVRRGGLVSFLLPHRLCVSAASCASTGGWQPAQASLGNEAGRKPTLPQNDAFYQFHSLGVHSVGSEEHWPCSRRYEHATCW